MIKVEGQDLWREGIKIGYIANDHIFNHLGTKLGYFSGNAIYDVRGNRLAHLDEEFIYFANSSRKIRIEDYQQDVIGGYLPNVERTAVRLLLGD